MLSSPRANEIQSRILPLNQFDLVRAEDVVAEIWLDILGVNSVAGDDDFFEMGGNSLDSALLLSRIQARFSLSLQTEDFFQARTFGNLCRLLQESKPNSLISNKPIIEVAANRSEFPATSAQSRLWFLDRFISQPEVYNVYRLVRLLGDLDVAVLSAALGALSRKHEPLRTRLDEYNGEPVQFVEPSISIDVAFSDLSALPESERFPRVKREAEEEARRPFNLQQAPLWSVRLWRIDTEDFFLLVNFHHCITDGVSINQFFAELTEAYQAIRVGSEMDRHRLQIQYGDYAIWEKAWRSQSEFQEHLAYWKQVLTPPPASLDLPFSRPRPKIQTFRGSVVRFEITAAKLVKLDEFALTEQSTRFMVGLTAFLSVLHRYTGETDLCIGTPVANRRPDTEELIGFFVNTLSLRNRIDGKMTFRDAISAVRKSTLQALAHSGVPFETIVEAVNPVRDTSRQPLFKIAFLYQNQGLLPTNLGPHDMLPISLHNGTSMFDIRFVLEDKLGGGLKAWIEYNTDLFDEIYIDRLAAHFQTLLDAALANPSEQIQHLPLLPETERRKILHEWNRTEGAYPSERKIHELFEETAIRQKNAAAILTSGETWSYERLNGRANQIAHYLIGLGLKPNEFVSVALPRCPEMIAAVLAISKAGGAYVPLDLSSPAERLNHMIQDSNSKWVLTNSDSLPKLEIADEAKLLVLDKLDLRSQPNRNPAKIGTSNDLAYVIYTSGSTGLPKGVLLRHKPVANVLDWVNTTFRVHHTDRLLFVTSLSFDLSVYDIFGILGAGGSLRLASEDELRNPLRLLEILQTEKITLWDSAPALLQQLSHFFDKNKRSGDLRLVLLSGDWIPVSLPQQIRDVFPTSRVVSLGGATEAAIWSNWFSIDEVDSGWVSIPYGKPIRNAHYHILNENLQPQPLGVPGELHIGGEVLADGYLNRQELTAERFIPDPFTDREGSKLYKTGDLARYWPDGNIEFLGRIDHQVKIRGFRVELGEVERALESFPGVAQAVVFS